MTIARELTNYLDAEGYPVCPTCGHAILPAQGVMRIADCMIHVLCFTRARVDPEPCEPAP